MKLRRVPIFIEIGEPYRERTSLRSSTITAHIAMSEASLKYWRRLPPFVTAQRRLWRGGTMKATETARMKLFQLQIPQSCMISTSSQPYPKTRQP